MTTPSTRLDSIELAGERLLVVHDTALAAALAPGRFILVRCAPDHSFDPYLRRAFFPCRIQVERATLRSSDAEDTATQWLYSQSAGAKLDWIGPFGNGFTLPAHARHLLLVAEGPHVLDLLPLIPLALDRGCHVELLATAATARQALPPSMLPHAVEYQLVTTHGSPGKPGQITGLLEGMTLWADQVCASGSMALYQTLRSQIEQERFQLGSGFAQILWHGPLPCGLGACLACLTELRNGLHRACRNGPVFDLTELP